MRNFCQEASLAPLHPKPQPYPTPTPPPTPTPCARWRSVAVTACRQDDGSGLDGLVPGMATYTIPGISFTMPSSVGPLQFSPLFTTRHTAEIAWVWTILFLGCLVVICHLSNACPQSQLVAHCFQPVAYCLHCWFVSATCSI